MNCRRNFLVGLPALALGLVASAQAQVKTGQLKFDGIDSAKTVEEIKKSILFGANWTEGEFEGRKLLFGVAVQPTDGISIIDVHGWIYSEYFKEWRRILKVNTRHLGSAKLLLKNGIVSIHATANNEFKDVEILRFDLRATSNDAD